MGHYSNKISCSTHQGTIALGDHGTIELSAATSFCGLLQQANAMLRSKLLEQLLKARRNVGAQLVHCDPSTQEVHDTSEDRPPVMVIRVHVTPLDTRV